MKPFQNLSTPGLEHPRIDLLESLEVGLERSRRHELRDEHDVLLVEALHRRRLGRFPRVVESDNVRVLEPLQHLCLVAKALPFNLAQFALLLQSLRVKN